MVLFPSGGLGRLIFVIILITTLSYVVLNLVSFGGNRWISYVDVPIRFGLWRVCDTSGPGLCNQWSDDVFISNITNVTFNGGKPGFVRSSQALEIISLIFYLIAAGLIIIGLIDLEEFPVEIAFIIAGGLLFICIIFLSASLGLMGGKGRSNHPLSFLDWAWWNGLVGLLMTIFCFLSLISFLAYIRFSSSFSSIETKPKTSRGSIGKGILNRSSSPSTVLDGRSPPIITTNPPYNSLNPNSYPQIYSSNQYVSNPLMSYGNQPPFGEYLNPNSYPQVYSSNQYVPNPLMSYVNQPQFGEYLNDQNPSPIISGLVRQYVFQANDALYQRQLLEPYREYLKTPYIINNYL